MSTRRGRGVTSNVGSKVCTVSLERQNSENIELRLPYVILDLNSFVVTHIHCIKKLEQTLNIFLLDHDIERCAQYHCDQHVVKMILESVQILCTSLNKMELKTPYRSTHNNHPCVLWVGDSYDNFLWLKDLTLFLNDEYLHRFEKQNNHRSIDVLESISGYRYRRRGLTPFAQAMPGEYKIAGDPVAAYRRFYIAEKLSFARWTRRDKPEWIVDEKSEAA
ncbi:MAG: hypothetical protein ACI8P9_004487 [Parasphingorhabdus sp.]